MYTICIYKYKNYRVLDSDRASGKTIHVAVGAPKAFKTFHQKTDEIKKYSDP